MVNSFFNRFTPREPKFFPLFKQMTLSILTGADLLVECTKASDHALYMGFFKKIKDQERICDKLSYRVFEELNSTFITPFDREDIHQLALHMDDVMDGINSSAKRIAWYKPKQMPENATEMAVLIKEAAGFLCKVTDELEILKKNSKRVKAYCSDLHDIENKADDVYEKFVIQLFENENDAIELYKLKEIVYEMEKTVDIIDQVGKIIRTIILKYS